MIVFKSTKTHTQIPSTITQHYRIQKNARYLSVRSGKLDPRRRECRYFLTNYPTRLANIYSRAANERDGFVRAPQPQRTQPIPLPVRCVWAAACVFCVLSVEKDLPGPLHGDRPTQQKTKGACTLTLTDLPSLAKRTCVCARTHARLALVFDARVCPQVCATRASVRTCAYDCFLPVLCVRALRWR